MMKKLNIAFISIVTLAFLTGCSPEVIVRGTSEGETSTTMSAEETSDTEVNTIDTYYPADTTGDNPTGNITSSASESSETSGTSETFESSSSGFNSSSDSETGSGICGNLILESGEECDNGTRPSIDCTIDCKFAFCGDGFVNKPFEDCDDSNLEDLDECSNDCYKSRLVFLTSDYIGVANFGGLAIADKFCQSDASKFGLAGTYMAWLSDDDALNSPIFRFKSEDFKGWYKLRTQFPTPLAKGWLGLQEDLLFTINFQANGASDQAVVSIWTATETTGERAEGSTCENWTKLGLGPEYEVHSGNPQKTTFEWTNGLTKSCSSGIGAKLYCFQVGE